jgi:hypothetical protein
VNLSNSHIGKYVLHKLDDELLEIVKSKTLKKILYSNENLHNDEIMNNYILNSQDEVIHINTNTFPDINNITQDIKDFIKNIFKLTPEFEKIFNSYLEKTGTNFDIFHYRFGDDIFKNDCVNIRKIVYSIQQINSTNNFVVIGDSLNVKKELYNMYNNNKIIVFLHKPTHTKDTSDEDVIYIFIDFFLASRAKNIYCWCAYGRMSNFILWHSYIYDIPLIKIEV